MASLSSSSIGHRISKRPISPSRDGSSKFFASSKSIIKVNLSQFPPGRGNMLFPSAPVTPDPNSSSKIRRSKKVCSSKATTAITKGKGDQSNVRLNKFVRRLHDMLVREKHTGIVEWRRGLLVLFSTDAFSKKILPKYFNTRNFKTFRRQLNYYGFVHVRSFSATGNTTTALWINQNLAEDEANDDVSAVLKLRRVEPNEVSKTVEGRRIRKELAIHTVEEDIGLTSKTLQLDQIRSMAIRGEGMYHQEDDRLHGKTTRTSFDTSTLKTSAPILSPTNYCSTEDDESTGSSSDPASEQSTKPEKDAIANAGAAASVLLMLSRS